MFCEATALRVPFLLAAAPPHLSAIGALVEATGPVEIVFFFEGPMTLHAGQFFRHPMVCDIVDHFASFFKPRQLLSNRRVVVL